MKTTSLIKGLLIQATIFCSAIIIASAQNKTGQFLDTRDSTIYRTVRIGNQTWMAENLNFKTDSCWCYGDSLNNCSKYGRLYNWETATRACPAGWHLPTDLEFTELITHTGGYETAGGALKKADTLLWNKPNKGAVNTSGFTALPGGIRNADGTFTGLGYFGSWWTATDVRALLATSRDIYYHENSVIARFDSNKKAGFSVRCIKDTR